MNSKSIHQLFIAATFVVAATTIMAAQQAQIYIHVHPPEAQIFVDGKTWGVGNRTIEVTPGTHTVGAYNYGFAPQTREVSLREGENPSLEFTLSPVGGSISAPWGRIQIEDAPNDAAVFLNGSSSGYFVGHADMFNNNNVWRQQLVVPAGKHQVLIISRGHDPIWSGMVDVPPNKRVIVHVATGAITVKNWPQGARLSSLPRFMAGAATASVAVAPVSANFSTDPTHINCGDTARLTWSTQEAVDTLITANSANMGELPVSGQRTDQPKQTTTYDFKTAGPGGVVTSAATVEVNTAVQANVVATPTEVRYHRMGDRVVEQSPTTLNWTSSNADSASMDPIGTVGTAGQQSVKPVPRQSADGPVDENVVYTFVAKNMCGGSETRSANVHITGMIEPVPVVPLASVFFPTGYPGVKHPQIGLVRSQDKVLAKTAEMFKKYLVYDPEARITLLGHADVRGSAKLNQPLSERRANRVKASLAAQGISENKIDAVGVGEQQNLDRADILKLQAENPHKSRLTKQPSQALVWAYNRRVDVTLLPTGQKSTQFFPGDAEDAKLIFHSTWQNRQAVKKAGEGAATDLTTTSEEQRPATKTVAARSSK